MLDVADLADEPLLLLHRTFGSREWFDAACGVAHIRPRVLVESAAPHTLIALAVAGYGVGVVPSTVLVPRSARAMALVQRGTSTGRWLTVAWDPHRSLPAYAAQFADELAQPRAEIRSDRDDRGALRRGDAVLRWTVSRGVRAAEVG